MHKVLQDVVVCRVNNSWAVTHEGVLEAGLQQVGRQLVLCKCKQDRQRRDDEWGG